MARRYAIQHPNGRFAYFREKAQESKDAVLIKRPFGVSWDDLVRDGYKCVKVDIKVIETVA